MYLCQQGYQLPYWPCRLLRTIVAALLRHFLTTMISFSKTWGYVPSVLEWARGTSLLQDKIGTWPICQMLPSFFVTLEQTNYFEPPNILVTRQSLWFFFMSLNHPTQNSFSNSFLSPSRLYCPVFSAPGVFWPCLSRALYTAVYIFLCFPLYLTTSEILRALRAIQPQTGLVRAKTSTQLSYLACWTEVVTHNFSAPNFFWKTLSGPSLFTAGQETMKMIMMIFFSPQKQISLSRQLKDLHYAIWTD